MSDIFLSYAHEDIQRVEPLAKALESLGWSVFWDHNIPSGKTWREVIGTALETSHCVLVVWSYTSIRSSWVLEEADEARERGVMVPVLIDDVRPPLGFRSYQAQSLTKWNPANTSAAFDRLVHDISNLIGTGSHETSGRSVSTTPKLGATQSIKAHREVLARNTVAAWFDHVRSNSLVMWVVAALSLGITSWYVYQTRLNPGTEDGNNPEVAIRGTELEQRQKQINTAEHAGLTKVKIRIRAASDLNPDAGGRPSPLVVHIYKLMSVYSFRETSFFELHDDFMKVLGRDVKGRDELVLSPGQRITIEQELDPETRYVGVVANYINLDEAAWRSTIEINAGRTNFLDLEFGHLSVSLRPTASKVHARLEQQVNAFCERAIRGRYPFDGQAEKDVSLEDFYSFFGPDGVLDQIIETYPEVLQKPTGKGAKSERTVSKRRRLPDDTLAALRAAVSIQRAFGFSSESSTYTEFLIKPAFLDASLKGAVLDFGQQRLTFNHGPVRARIMLWSPSSTGARIIANPSDASPAMSIEQKGPWAWFRLLDQAQEVQITDHGRAMATFLLGSGKVVLEIESLGFLDYATMMEEMSVFQCPFEFK